MWQEQFMQHYTGKILDNFLYFIWMLIWWCWIQHHEIYSHQQSSWKLRICDLFFSQPPPPFPLIFFRLGKCLCLNYRWGIMCVKNERGRKDANIANILMALSNNMLRVCNSGNLTLVWSHTHTHPLHFFLVWITVCMWKQACQPHIRSHGSHWWCNQRRGFLLS